MNLIGLDKKLFIVQHKLTNEELSGMQLPKEEFEKIIRQGIYNKTIEMLFQTTKVKQHQDETGVIWEYRMFMFADRDLWTLLLEVLELDEEDRVKKLEEVKKILGIFTP
jgi:hypothetical protein